MGFLSGLVSATVKTALSPIAIVKDVVNVATGQDADATKDLIKSAGNDVGDAFNNLGNGDLV